MTDDVEKWDRFWSETDGDDLGESAAPQTWYELVWQVSLQYWYDVFETHAPGRNMLECGCGTARVSRYMAARGYICTMADYSLGALQHARESFGRRALPGRFVAGDLNALGLADGEFDVAFSGGVLQHFEDFEPAIREMVRVLRPGGLFAAMVVPRKFSCQTLGDLQQTVVHSARNLLTGRPRQAFRRISHFPDFYVNPARLDAYMTVCRNAGLTGMVGRANSPFPNLSLPGWGARVYGRFLRGVMPYWRRFNESSSALALRWGITYTIFGWKGPR